MKGFLGVPCERCPGRDFEQIFSWVSQGRVDYGIVPIENSLEASVTTNLDLLTTEDIFIRGEVILDIDHCLLGLGEGAEILGIISHPQALAQCRRNLKRLYPDARGHFGNVYVPRGPGGGPGGEGRAGGLGMRGRRPRSTD